jgi:hypothetical protein
MFLVSSTIIEDIKLLCEAGEALMAYFYFDFRNVNKQGLYDLLPSLLTQLSARSSLCCDILSKLYSIHDNGKDQPSNSALTKCLKDMLTLPDQPPIYLIMDGARRISEHLWDSITSREGSSASEGPCRPSPIESSYMCH